MPEKIRSSLKEEDNTVPAKPVSSRLSKCKRICVLLFAVVSRVILEVPENYDVKESEELKEGLNLRS